MPLGLADKKYFGFVKGINTEAPLVGWPEGFTVDEQNFDLLSDGSRRRRPVIDLERGTGTADLVSDHETLEGDAFRVEFWNAVKNDSNVNLVVVQMGYMLYFFYRPEAGMPLPPNIIDTSIDLRDYRVFIEDPEYAADENDIRQWPVDITFGQGRMFVVGKHTEPFFAEFDIDEEEVTAEKIVIQERDFVGIEDGISIGTNPNDLTDDHRYNLQNRGWLPENYEQFKTDTGLYPSKTQIQWRGMQRATTTGFNPDDGIKQFSSDKLVKELFQDSSAPQGHMRLNTFDTRIGYDPSAITGITDSGTFTAIMDFAAAPGDFVYVTLESTAHGLSLSDIIDVVNLKLTFNTGHGWATQKYNGPYSVLAIPSVDEIKIMLPWWGPTGTSPIFKGGTWTTTAGSTGVYLTRSTNEADALRYRFTSTEFFAGRVWYAGAIDHRLGNKVYFSRISEDPEKAGQCYQQADPTSEFISELVPTDGGIIVIPEMQDVLNLEPFGHNLIVFARNGIWQIGPGELGIFSPTSYSVRKITSNGCISRFSVSVTENVPMYWALDGIYAMQEDPNTGFLVAQNMTRDVINTLYMNIPVEGRQTSRVAYDLYRKRVFWFYNPQQPLQTAVPPATGEDMPTTSPVTPIYDPADSVERLGFTHALIFDLRLGAWTKWAFSNGTGATEVAVEEPFVMPNDYVVNNETRVKMLTRRPTDGDNVVMEFRSDVADYEDFGITDARPDAFVATGPDSLGEPSRYRYAPIVTVFFKRVEGAQCQMQGRWDWSRGSDSGKMTNFYQIYRETRPDPTAYAMVVTKNKVPGRGRNLFLFFRTTGAYPTWLDGYTVHYDVLMKE